MNTYQQESLAAGATHVGEKGHGWRQHGSSWQVFKLGKGWVTEKPQSALTPLLNAQPIEQPPRHYIELVQSWERVKRMLSVHEQSLTHVSLYDLREAMNAHDALMEQR